MQMTEAETEATGGRRGGRQEVSLPLFHVWKAGFRYDIYEPRWYAQIQWAQKSEQADVSKASLLEFLEPIISTISHEPLVIGVWNIKQNCIEK